MNDKYTVKNGKKLRFGYTTGSCATAASTAAVTMLLNGGKEVSSVTIRLPGGERVAFLIEDITISGTGVSCSVIKDAGDDPDVTDKMKIFATARLCEGDVAILGGEGVGVVTAKGLKCAVGEPAINPVPRKMMLKNIGTVCSRFDYQGGVSVTISAPGGEEVAKHTFNPRLGIVGGISILGTTGIVEPMSEQALVDTIKVLIDTQKEQGTSQILISPGNYGRDYCKNQLHIDTEKSIKFSNYIGETLDYLVYCGFEKVLLVGHVGKLVKLAGGVMNTHSSYADCRMEILGVHTALAGGSAALVAQLMDCITTDGAIELLEQAGLCRAVFDSIMKKILFQINYRTKNKLQTEVIIFGAEDRVIVQSPKAAEFAALFEEDNIG